VAAHGAMSVVPMNGVCRSLAIFIAAVGIGSSFRARFRSAPLLDFDGLADRAIAMVDRGHFPSLILDVGLGALPQEELDDGRVSRPTTAMGLSSPCRCR